MTYRDGGEALGGAVVNASPLTITNSAFTDNLAKGGDMGDNSSDGVDGGGFVRVVREVAVADHDFGRARIEVGAPARQRSPNLSVDLSAVIPWSM